MSTPASPVQEPRKEDYTAIDSGAAGSDSPPPLEDIHSEDEDAPDQPIFIAAGDEDLHLWVILLQQILLSFLTFAMNLITLMPKTNRMTQEI